MTPANSSARPPGQKSLDSTEDRLICCEITLVEVDALLEGICRIAEHCNRPGYSADKVDLERIAKLAGIGLLQVDGAFAYMEKQKEETRHEQLHQQ